VQRLIQNKMLYSVCCDFHFFGARNPEVHYYFQRDGTELATVESWRELW